MRRRTPGGPIDAILLPASRRHERSSRRRALAAELTYDYAIIRVVPRVDRGEQINVGVIVSCAEANYLDARIDLDESLLLAIDPLVDITTVRANLAVIPAVCRGGAEGGPIGALDP